MHFCLHKLVNESYLDSCLQHYKQETYRDILAQKWSKITSEDIVHVWEGVEGAPRHWPVLLHVRIVFGPPQS